MADSQSETRLRIAGLLKQYRERAGLTIREAGKLLGKSNQTVSAWEQGRGQPDPDCLDLRARRSMKSSFLPLELAVVLPLASLFRPDQDPAVS